MQVFLNGELVEEEKALVSVFDRSFWYGDGLFETIRVHHGKPFRWLRHLERLEHGASTLGISVPHSKEQLTSFAHQLLEANAIPEALLRITLSRGVGGRGYAPAGAKQPTLVMTVHPLDEPGSKSRWRLHTSSVRVAARDPVAGHKSNNKLHQILAQAEAVKAGFDDALLLNTNGHMAEAATSNFFWIQGGTIRTAPLAAGILRGITREIVFELCDTLKLRRVETAAGPEALPTAEGAFVTLSSMGIVEVIAVDETPIPSSDVVERIRTAYAALLEQECSAS